jgi:Tfp pilus assembly protein PilF
MKYSKACAYFLDRFTMKFSHLSLIASVLCLTGCAAATSMTNGISSGSTAMVTKLGETGKTVKGQFSTLGTAAGSAYSKTKTMVTSAFTTTPIASESDPTSLSGKPPIIGPELYVASAANYEVANNFTKAEEAYNKALQIEPNNIAAILGSARLANRQKNSELAIEMYERAEKVDSNNTAIYAELAQVYADQNNLAQAKDQMQKAVNLEPDNRSHRQKLAGILLDQGQSTAALQEIQQVETPAMANYQMAYLYASRKNIPVAQQYLQTALQIDPNLKPARDLMGTLQNSAFAQQAYGSYQQAGQLYQGANNVYQQAGQVYQQATAVMSATPTPNGTVTR